MINGQDPYFMFRNLVLYLKEMNKVVKDSIMPGKLNTDESLNNFRVIIFFFFKQVNGQNVILINDKLKFLNFYMYQYY